MLHRKAFDVEVLGSRLSYCCRFIQNHNRYLCAYHLNKDDTTFGRGSRNYGKAEEEAQDWHARYGGFDWSSNAIPRAALKFLRTQGGLCLSIQADMSMHVPALV